MTPANRDNNTVLKEDIDICTNNIKLIKTDSDSEKFEENLIPILDGNTRAQAFRIADKVQDEAHKLWFLRRKKVIKNCLLELNRKNSYSFAGYMITTSNSQTVLGDIEKSLTFETLKHLLLCLLKQAEDCNLQESFQYRKLKKEYCLVLSTCGSNLNRKVSKKLARETDIHIENLYMEMSKVLH